MWHVISNLSLLLLVVPQLAMAQDIDRNKNTFMTVLQRNSCKVYESQEISNPPLERDQGDSGNCYAFAATYLADHEYCKRTKQKCGDPANSISMLAVLKINKSLVSSGGDPALALNNLSEKSGIATEACAPFMNVSSPNIKGWKKNQAALEGLRSLYNGVQKGKICSNYGAVNNITDLKVSSDQFEAAIQGQSFEEFAEKITIPPECAAKGLTLPPLKIAGIRSLVPIAKSKNMVDSGLQYLIKQDKPVMFTFCTTTDCSEGHAMVIHGYKDICCKDKLGRATCNRQYHVYNSARIHTPNGKELPPQNMWFDGNWIAEKVAEQDEYYAKKGINRVSLVFIE